MKKTISNFIMYIILILVSITMLVPFVWMFLTAFKTVSETMQIDPFVIIPKVWQVQNFENVIKAMDFVRLYANTLGMVGLRILFAVVTASLSGYAFARLNFKGKNVMFALVLFQMMIPVQLFIIPQYVMVSNLHLTNSIIGLVFLVSFQLLEHSCLDRHFYSFLEIWKRQLDLMDAIFHRHLCISWHLLPDQQW